MTVALSIALAAVARRGGALRMTARPVIGRKLRWASPPVSPDSRSSDAASPPLSMSVSAAGRGLSCGGRTPRAASPPPATAEGPADSAPACSPAGIGRWLSCFSRFCRSLVASSRAPCRRPRSCSSSAARASTSAILLRAPVFSSSSRRAFSAALVSDSSCRVRAAARSFTSAMAGSAAPSADCSSAATATWLTLRPAASSAALFCAVASMAAAACASSPAL
mmetsp:Transcript_28431/g.67683  ORF Transcript_28431/g.67683 Transcript_28431/m.67683 type:complete len:222 (+) Transcript_28431:323-988(+)